MADIPPSAELKIVHYPRPSSLGEIFESLSSIGVTQVLDVLAQANAGAFPLSFEQQLTLFSQRPQALCWMAVPDFYQPRSLRGLLQDTMFGGSSADPIERLLHLNR